MTLDATDLRILTALQQDGQVSNAALAETLGMSASSCWRRVRALEEAGAIERPGVRLNPEACGLSFQAIVHVSLVRHEMRPVEDFIRAVRGRAEIQECYATTGQADYHLRVLCRDLAAYNAFLEDFLFRQPAVASAQTNMVLRAVKTSGVLPL